MQRRLVLALLLILTGVAGAQDAVIEPQTGSVTVKLVNGTTGEPGEAERVELREIGFAMRLLASAANVAGEVVFPGVRLLKDRPYLAVALRGAVAYRAQLVGQKFLDGDAITVYVFDQTESLDGVSVSGMNVIVRRQAAGCELEYLLTVENAARPQRTIAAGVLPVRVVVPSLTAAAAEMYRGPEPEPVEIAAGPDGLVGPRIALTPGTTRVVLKGFWDVPGPARLEIGCSLPVTAWSLMVSPTTLAVLAPDLSRDAGDYPDFARLRGPALTPGQTVRVDLPALSDDLAGEAGSSRSNQPPAAAKGAPGRAAGSGSHDWVWTVAIVVSVLLLGVGLWQRRRH
jgi:hypothetical protein